MPSDLGRAQVDAAVPSRDPAELQARLADGRRVDDGDEFGEVVDQEPVEEDLVPVHEALEVDVFFEVVLVLPPVRVACAFELQFQR
jgi:hypothetical protein